MFAWNCPNLKELFFKFFFQWEGMILSYTLPQQYAMSIMWQVFHVVLSRVLFGCHLLLKNLLTTLNKIEYSSWTPCVLRSLHNISSVSGCMDLCQSQHLMGFWSLHVQARNGQVSAFRGRYNHCWQTSLCCCLSVLVLLPWRSGGCFLWSASFDDFTSRSHTPQNWGEAGGLKWLYSMLWQPISNLRFVQPL